MPERPNEEAARHILASVLGVPVTPHDDGRRDSMVDALIHYPDRTEAVEVVADHDPAFNAQWEALRRLGHRIQVPGLRSGWHVELEHRTRVRDVREQLGELLRDMESVGWSDLRHVDADQLGEQAAVLGVSNVYEDPDGPPGVVRLSPQPWSGFAPGVDFADWTEAMLARHKDVPRKLAMHSGATGHTFLWATMASDFSLQFALENRGQPLGPHRDPALPDGVTHVWIAGAMSSQGAVAWDRQRGWWRTPWVWPPREAARED